MTRLRYLGTRRRARRVVPTLAAVAATLTAVGLVVAGCGGGSSSTEDAGAAATTAAPAATTAAPATEAEPEATTEAAEAAGPEITPPASIADAGKIRYCIDWNNPPLEFNDGGPVPKGSDPDLGHALAELMGVTDEWQYLSFDGLIAATLAGKCDALLSGVDDTAERREVLDFVDYAYIGNNVMVLEENAGEKVDTLADLSDKRVGVHTGTTAYDRLVGVNEELEKEGKPPIKFVFFNVSGNGPTALLTDKIDAHYNQAPVQAFAMAQNPGEFAIVSGVFDAVPVGIATSKDNAELNAALQAGVDLLYENGQMCAILADWELQPIALPDKPPCS